MNERIKELSRQAHLYAIDRYGLQRRGELVWNPHNYEEKLVELIIKEATSLTLDYKSEDYYQGWLDYRDTIRKHFDGDIDFDYYVQEAEKLVIGG